MTDLQHMSVFHTFNTQNNTIQLGHAISNMHSVRILHITSPTTFTNTITVIAPHLHLKTTSFIQGHAANTLGTMPLNNAGVVNNQSPRFLEPRRAMRTLRLIFLDSAGNSVNTLANPLTIELEFAIKIC